jgi:hypothetical protein
MSKFRGYELALGLMCATALWAIVFAISSSGSNLFSGVSLDSILPNYVKSHWQDAKDFFNSTFFTAIIGTLAGAYGGAHAAQSIAKRAKRREELLKEIHATNATLSLTYHLCNTYFNAKKQLIKPMKDDYDRQLKLLEERLARPLPIGVEVRFLADYRTLPTMEPPVSIIRDQIFEKIGVYGRPTVLVATLGQTIDQLKTVIVNRNALIEDFRTGGMNDVKVTQMYFGLPDASGRMDRRYRDLLEAIYRCTDDVLFFGLELCSELGTHGDKLATALRERSGKDQVPTISKPDFSKAKEAGLMPDYDNYRDWFTGFPKTKAGSQ